VQYAKLSIIQPEIAHFVQILYRHMDCLKLVFMPSLAVSQRRHKNWLQNQNL